MTKPAGILAAHSTVLASILCSLTLHVYADLLAKTDAS